MAIDPLETAKQPLISTYYYKKKPFNIHIVSGLRPSDDTEAGTKTCVQISNIILNAPSTISIIKHKVICYGQQCY
jgi:hypothetical protein